MNASHYITPNPAEPLMDRCCQTPWEMSIDPIRMAPNIWYVSGQNWVAAYLIDTGEGLILIDTGMQEVLFLLTESIRKLGFDPHDIKMILLSHAHADHCGGLRPLAEYTGAEIYMDRHDLLFTEQRKELIFARHYCCGDFHVDHFYSDQEPIVLGNTRIRTVHCPGHTPGSTSYIITVPDGKGGELVCAMHGGIGPNTLTDEALRASGLPASLREDYLASMAKLRDIPVDIVLPSHTDHVVLLEKADQVTDDYNPYIDRSAWKKMIDYWTGRVEQLMKESTLPASGQ